MKIWGPPNPDLQNQNLQGIGCKSLYFRDFSGALVFKTPCSQWRGHRFSPWLGNKDPACCAGWPEEKKERRRKEQKRILTRFPGYLSACYIFRSTAILQRPSRVFLRVLCCCDLCVIHQTSFEFLLCRHKTKLTPACQVHALQLKREDCLPIKR